MKWTHITERQPDNGQLIIIAQISDYGEGKWLIGRKKYDGGLFDEKYIEWCKENKELQPDYWWVPQADFPFPDKLEVIAKYEQRSE